MMRRLTACLRAAGRACCGSPREPWATITSLLRSAKMIPMMLPKVKKVMGALLALMLLDLLALHSYGQDVTDEGKPPVSAAGSLGFTPARSIDLQRALDAHDYVAAEKLLLSEIDSDPHSARAARLLNFAGSVYFLNHDYLNAAIAWKKSEAIAPLDPRLKFSLAMAYLRMSRPDWART